MKLIDEIKHYAYIYVQPDKMFLFSWIRQISLCATIN